MGMRGILNAVKIMEFVFSAGTRETPLHPDSKLFSANTRIRIEDDLSTIYLTKSSNFQ
jgi:hypothetical protein